LEFQYKYFLFNRAENNKSLDYDWSILNKPIIPPTINPIPNNHQVTNADTSPAALRKHYKPNATQIEFAEIPSQ